MQTYKLRAQKAVKPPTDTNQSALGISEDVVGLQLSTLIRKGSNAIILTGRHRPLAGYLAVIVAGNAETDVPANLLPFDHGAANLGVEHYVDLFSEGDATLPDGVTQRAAGQMDLVDAMTGKGHRAHRLRDAPTVAGAWARRAGRKRSCRNLGCGRRNI